MKVIIVDDHEVVRMGLRTLLERRGGVEVAGEAGTAAKAVEVALLHRPDVVLMDVRLPDESGIEACRKIRAALPKTRVIMLTSYSDNDAIFASVMAGASGYLLKQIGSENLYQSLLAVGRGESLMDPTITKTVMDRVTAICEGAPGRNIDSLTERDIQILELIAQGLTNREIAAEIYLGENTVRNYVSSILHKLDLSHRTQAAVYFLKRTNHEKE